jgi:maleate isomerase
VGSGNWGTKIGVLTPGTNLTVESELRALAVPSATVATARIHIDHIKWEKPDDLRRFVDGVNAHIAPTAAELMQVKPDILLLAIASSPLWGGVDGNAAIKERIKSQTGLEMITPVDAVHAALNLLNANRISVVTPYPQIADDKVVAFFNELGVQVIAQQSLRAGSAQEIGEVALADIVAAFRAACVPGIDAIVQLGTDLRTAVVAAQAELWLGLPALAANTTTWWHTLRQAGIDTQVAGWGVLLGQH